MTTRALFAALLACLFSACAERLANDDSYAELAREQYPQSKEVPPVYVRARNDGAHKLLQRKVRVNFPPGKVALQTALVKGLGFPVTVIAKDRGADLQIDVAARAENATVYSFLKQLEGVTGYEITLRPDHSIVEVSSVVVKTWTLPALAGMNRFRARLGFARTSNDSGTLSANNSGSVNRSHELAVRIEHNEDSWKHLVNHASCLLETPRCDYDDDSKGEKAAERNGPMSAWLADNPRLGMITASAPPDKIVALDNWFKKVAKQSQRLVNLECLILDLRLRDSSAAGLDFDAIFGDANNRLQFGNRTEGNLQQGLSIGGRGLQGEFSVNFILKSLAKHADVKIRSRARLAVTNGATAYLNTGEVFSYISGAGTVANNGVTTTTFEQDRLQVGLELAVTPRFVDDGKKMLVEVIPILSSLVRFDALGTGDSRVLAPVIALRQMTSQALTVSGRPVTIGGLSWSRLSQSASKLTAGKSVFNSLFGEHDDTSEKRELLIIITPREVAV